MAVLLAERERVALNQVAWQGTKLPEGIVPTQFETDESALNAFAQSWVIKPSVDPAQWVAWAAHFRGSIDVGESEREAVAFADEKVKEAGDDAIAEFAERVGAEVKELD